MTQVANVDVLPFQKNERGHYYIDIISPALRGATEVYNLENQGHKIDDAARALMLLNGPTSFDRRHMLEGQTIYRVVLVPNTDVATNLRSRHPEWDELKRREMTNATFLKYGNRRGYSQTLAGLHIRVHELIKPEHLVAMDCHHVLSLHEPIIGLDGHPWMLCSRLYRPTDSSLTLTLKSGSPQAESGDKGILVYRRRL